MTICTKIDMKLWPECIETTFVPDQLHPQQISRFYILHQLLLQTLRWTIVEIIWSYNVQWLSCLNWSLLLGSRLKSVQDVPTNRHRYILIKFLRISFILFNKTRLSSSNLFLTLIYFWLFFRIWVENYIRPFPLFLNNWFLNFFDFRFRFCLRDVKFLKSILLLSLSLSIGILKNLHFFNLLERS